MIPFLPCMALVAAYGISKLPWKTVAVLILLIICTENIAANLNDFRLKPKEAAVARLEYSMDKYSCLHDRIIINSGYTPTPMYLAHRKGWLAKNDELLIPSYLADKKQKGAQLVVVLKKVFGKDVQLPLPILEDTEDWTIYRL